MTKVHMKLVRRRDDEVWLLSIAGALSQYKVGISAAMILRGFRWKELEYHCKRYLAECNV